MPISSASWVLARGGRSMTTPSASSTSAAPQAEEAARLPCLAIRAPAAAATIVPMVEMLTVCAPSPPVPTRSATRPGMSMWVAWSSMAAARPPSSTTVSPLIRRATPNPAICAAPAAPSMISFIAHVASPAVSDSPLMSAPISAGQVVRVSIAALRPGLVGRLQRPARGTLAHQPGQGPGQRDRIDRVGDHGVSARPGGQPAVVLPADDQQHRRALIDLVLGLPADAHSAGRLRLTVQHHDLGSTGVQQPEQGWLGGDLDNLRLRDVGGGPDADGFPHLRAHVRVMAEHNDLHGRDGIDRDATAALQCPIGGSGSGALRVVVIMASWRQRV